MQFSSNPRERDLTVKFIGTPNFIDDNGNKYCGELKNGKPHGKGKMVYYTEDDERETKTYEGGWLNGKKARQRNIDLSRIK